MTQIGPATAAEMAHAHAVCAAADAIVLVSPQAVKAALTEMPDILRSKPVAVMGPSSRAVLMAAGVPAAQIVESQTQDAMGLAEHVLNLLSAGACVAIARAQTGRDDLARALSAHGLMVNFVTLYHRDELAWPRELPSTLMQVAQQDLRILFTTSSAPEAFVTRLRGAEVQHLAQFVNSTAAHCTHPNVAQAARDAGFLRVFTHLGDESTWLASLQSVYE